MTFGMTEQPSLAAPASRSDEVAAKLALVRGLIDRRGLPAIVLHEPGPVAWLSGGTTNRIEPGSSASPLWLVVTPDTVAAVTTNVEQARLHAESDLPQLGIEIHSAPWHEPGGLQRVAEALAGARTEQIGGLGVSVDDDLVELRLALSASEAERLSALGTDAARALENALRGWQPG